MIQRNILIFLAALSLSGCGFSLGEQNAVENMTFAELLVYSQSLTSDGPDDIEKKIEHLRSVTDFDVDTELGDGIGECEALSNHQVTSQQVDEEGHIIRSEFDIRGGYSAQLIFIGRGLDLGITTIFTPLYLETVAISGPNGAVYSGGPFEQSSFEMLKMAMVDCTIDRFLADYTNQIEQEKAQKAEAEQARIAAMKDSLSAGLFAAAEQPQCSHVLELAEPLRNSVFVADSEAGISRSLDDASELLEPWERYALSQIRADEGDIPVFQQIVSACGNSARRQSYLQALQDLPALREAKVAHQQGLLNAEGRPLSETTAGKEAEAWLAQKNESAMQCDKPNDEGCRFKDLSFAAAEKAATQYVRCEEGVEGETTSCFKNIGDHFTYTFASMRLGWIDDRLQVLDKQIDKVRRSWDYENELENCKQDAITEGLRGSAYSDHVKTVCEPDVFNKLSADARTEKASLQSLQSSLIATKQTLEKSSTN